MARPLTLSIDAMGGDYAPDMVVAGCAISRIRHPDVHFLMHGPKDKLEPLLAKHAELAASTKIRDDTAVVGMDDKPSQALRRGRATTMWRTIEAVRHHDADVAVSAGNTGALMAMAKFQLKPMAGIHRPAIATIWPTMRGQTVLLDAGANVGCDAYQLVDFAIMGEAFARVLFGLARPTVGLLNIGIEEMKGTEALKSAAQVLRQAKLPLQFHGFVEGDDICAGTVDVVVTDGFTGNVALKAAEGTARLVGKYLRDSLNRSLLARIGAFLASGAFKVLKKKMDPRTANGGVFLGLNGVVVKSHGGTDGFGFASAVDLGVDMAKGGIVQGIAADLAALTPDLFQQPAHAKSVPMGAAAS